MIATNDEGRALLKLQEIAGRLVNQKVKAVTFEFLDVKIGKRPRPLALRIQLENNEVYEFYLDKKAIFPLGTGKGEIKLTKV